MSNTVGLAELLQSTRSLQALEKNRSKDQRSPKGTLASSGNCKRRKRKRKVETENGKRKREMVVTAIRTQSSTSYQCQDRSSSSKSRSASLGRCKTWTLDSGTHELTDIWTPDKTVNDDMTHMPCIQPCPSSVQCTSGGFGD